MKFISAFLILFLMASISHAGGGLSAGAGNPASQNCRMLGGDIEFVQNDLGIYGNCVIESSLLYIQLLHHGTFPASQIPSAGPQSIRMESGRAGSPANEACLKIGGKVRANGVEKGGRTFCVIEEFALMKAIDVF